MAEHVLKKHLNPYTAFQFTEGFCSDPKTNLLSYAVVFYYIFALHPALQLVLY